MRYEHIEWNLSTAACDALRKALRAAIQEYRDTHGEDDSVYAELLNCNNELRARLQRRDADPHCPLNTAAPEADPLLS